MKKFLAVLLAVCMVVSMLTVAVINVGAADSTDTKTITVGVISYVINDLGNTGYQVRYWGGADGAKDADLTPTGTTEMKSVGNAYWNGDEQQFTMFTATVPADFTGYKVHNGGRWFGNDGTAAKTTAYIFNYSGDKALYEESVEPATEEPSQSATDAPAAEKAYYLVGTMNSWTAEDAFKLSKNEASTENEEYLLSGVALTTKDEFKIVCTDGNEATAVWYPIGGDNYSGIAKDSTYTVYFRPNADGFEDWYMGTIIAIDEVVETQPATDEQTEPATDKPTEPATDAPATKEPTQPATDAPPAEKAYYLVGTMNNWTAEDAFKLSKNEASTENEEYLLSGVALTTKDEFKIVCTDGNEAAAVWYPDPGDNYSGIKKDSTYTVYFRPNGDGYEDWYMGIINAIDEVVETAPVTDAPTQPATDKPTEPATDAPVTVPAEKAYYLVGTMNNWTAEDAFKLSKNEASTENEEYLLSGVALTTKDEFKIVCTDGNEATAVWYPEPGDNYSGIKKDSTYTVYFRPNGDGYEDWYMGIINAIDEVVETAPVTDEPTQPATDVTEIPLDGSFNLVGTINGTEYYGTDYTFENGAVTLDTTATSYVFVKQGETAFMTNGFDPEATEVTLYNVAITGDYSDKLMVPAGKSTLTLKAFSDGTFKLSYVLDEAYIEPVTDATATEPAEKAYYLVGTMNEWTAEDAFKLSKNEASTENEEYLLSGVALTTKDEFKIVCTDGNEATAVWYPIGGDNYSGIKKDSTYTVYFRPNGDGYEDWYMGTIIAIDEVTETTPVTDEPTVPTVPTDPTDPTPSEPAEKAYYLVGTMNNWTAEDAFKLSRNEASTENEEYLLSGVALTTKDEFKIVCTDGDPETAVWYPIGGDNYSGFAKDSTYTVYFRPNGDGFEDWYMGTIIAIDEVVETAPVTDEPTQPVTDEPAEKAYYLVGTMNSWTAEDAFKLSKNEASTENEEYLLSGVALTTKDEFKIVCTDGDPETAVWYPIGGDNYSGFAKDSTYTVYFRPNGDGFEDWYMGTIIAIDEVVETAPVTDEPTQPTTNVTEIPLDGSFNLVGTINGTEYYGTDYTFANGKLTLDTTATSYVFIKQGDTSYMTFGFDPEATEVTLYDVAITGEESDKLMVPAGKATLTLKAYSDGTFKLSYVLDEAYTEPASDVPGEKAYYLVGTMNEWTASDAYKLSRNIASTENEEYLLSGVALTTKDEFKIVCTDGDPETAVWYPIGGDNYSGFAKDSTYTVYFRPNADGFEDWYMGTIIAIDEVTETQPVTDEPSQPVTDEPGEKAYYLVGTMNNWTAEDAFKLSKNEASTENEEYLLSGVALTTKDEFKIVCTDGNPETAVWYPIGGDNYSGFAKDSTYTVYFRPNADGFEDWYMGTIIAIDEVTETQPVTDEPSQPVTDEPGEKAYYLVGTMNNWTAEEGFKLSKNEASTENEEYLLSGVALTTKDEFKIVCTDGDPATAVWYPIGGDNYSGFAKDSTYTVYFRPNADGYEDWYMGTIIAIDEVTETQPATEEPSDPTPSEPAEKAYYLVGTMNNWTAEEGFKLSKNIASTENEEYLISGVALTTKDEFKIVCTDGDPETAVWYPDPGDNYSGIAKDGTYTVYFRPNGDGYEDWYMGIINVISEEAPTDPTDPTDPTPSDPVAESGYYVVGTMTGWEIDEAYKLAKNEGATENEEYTFENLELTPDSEFKVVYSADGTEKTTWFPEGNNNNYGQNGEITEAGAYTVYFRPNYDGYEDWFNGCIAVIGNKPQLQLGDVNMDGKVDIQDATLLQSCLAEMTTLTDEQLKLADVDQDGFVNVRDVTAIQRIVAEMSLTFH